MKNNSVYTDSPYFTNNLLKKDLLSKKVISNKINKLPEVLVISTFPPKECGIASYTQDLIQSLRNNFNESFDIKICALDSENQREKYKNSIQYLLDTNSVYSFIELANEINENENIHVVLIQHEFGLFKNKEAEFLKFLNKLNKSVLVVFHTVLPEPNELLQKNVQQIVSLADGIIVMTNSSSTILENDYQVRKDKISIIPHGTHLVNHTDKKILKKKYNLSGKKVLSTFGLLSAGKCIETTLDALPEIVKENPDVVFLIIGKTHPSVLKNEGEQYREMLEAKIETLFLNKNVRFINSYLPLEDLLEYLQLSDIYLFTSKDPNQAVSGTFSYALSCGCPIISTPIPHACEVLKDGAGIIIDFEKPKQLAKQVINLLNDEQLMKNISSNELHIMASTAWENSSIAHAKLFENTDDTILLHYTIPKINLNHIKKLTTSFGIIQFSIINQPDINSGYTLDDNARALVALCQHYKLTKNNDDLVYINRYINFIKYCFQEDGYFLNYVNENKEFTEQNYQTNLEDSNGRAIWSLGFLISISDILPNEFSLNAEKILKKILKNVNNIHSTRSMAFIIKGLYYYNLKNNSLENIFQIRHLADKMLQMYKHETDTKWYWFESYLTYANSILSEAMLYAWEVTGNIEYKTTARVSFDFLLSKLYKKNIIKVISNNGWLHNSQEISPDKKGGEQPIDVAYTILTLSRFYDVFKDEDYFNKMETAFSWFLGNNHLNQIIYNPCTGGCYDGLEDTYINLNQGAESTVSYLMARLTIEKYSDNKQQRKNELIVKQFQE